MKELLRVLLVSLAIAVGLALDGSAQAQEQDSWWDDSHQRQPGSRHRSSGNAIVNIGGDSHLKAGERADAVVAIGGNATNEGEVHDAVVSIFGDTKVTGALGDAAVAVFGNTYVNGQVGGDAVAIFGNVELGPEAIVAGEVVAVAGKVLRDPSAVVGGGVQQVGPGNLRSPDWLRPWFREAGLLGRPLAFGPDLGWAWGLVIGFLVLYMLLAFLFSDSVEKCVHTLERRPGQTVLVSILTVLLSPVLFILLVLTVFGIALVPIIALGAVVAVIFGKAVVLAALGRRLTRYFEAGPLAHLSFAVLVGGIIVTAFYLVPVVGFILYYLLALLGLGTVLYTLLLAMRNARELRVAAAAAAPGSTTVIASNHSTQSETGAAFAAAVTATSLPRATFGIRMAALLIDVVLVGFVLSVIDNDWDITLLILAAYGAIMWKLRGATIGGIILNVQIVRADGREMDWTTSIVRALSCFLSLVAAGLGFFWILLDEERQGWHDKIAGTLVVRSPRGRSLV